MELGSRSSLLRGTTYRGFDCYEYAGFTHPRHFASGVLGTFPQVRQGAGQQPVTEGRTLLESSYTPSAAPAMGDGSCAARQSMSPRFSASSEETQIKENTDEPTSGRAAGQGACIS
jgi:hypothetical protein